MSNKLNALDLAFLSLEKQSTPVNVASLAIFEIPPNYEGNFPRDLLEKLEKQRPGPPFNQKLSSVRSAALPSWEIDNNFDIHYHVRHSALPKPGTVEDLLELASRLHSRLLDRERPLWEFHLIEGLENNQFALYMKMHHAAIDGMGGIELMENCLSLAVTDEVRAPWIGVPKHKKVNGDEEASIRDKANKVIEKLGSNTKMVQDLSKMFMGQGLKAVGIDKNTSPVPFSAPKSLFNVPITGARRFAVKALSLSEIKALGKQADATVNDIVLALCSEALRKYMLDKKALTKKSLIASVPVSVRQVNRSGNQITYVIANLATNEPDTMTRLQLIGQSTNDAKNELMDVSADAATNFAVMAQGLVAVMNQLNLSKLTPPAANVTISNVPGPRAPLYFGQAELKATYPMSVLIDGQSLNITVVSYCDTIGFGLMACRDTIPDVQVIADYIESAIDSIKGGIFLQNLMKEKDNE
ncbi:WS/DGAT/MGAT family O-acyltransferase [Glaciecola petra]|uniref:diacylglycerol O-acyltransferase n=1 Tax=Glaciecola petra TaxID=3075602 RepID=A0ABU2ZNC1_9ALTE|nr:wax ester/triacylglycerol synthase family O-acyltransferase [Aestuariibacter sp. P117]MDT0594119.1 wax ester/triacylglycerol synthase family O-acyltransferase [Aestuariibacter sp. P117]